jgi:hypothetical protein
LSEVRGAQIVVRLGEVGHQADGAAIRLDRLRQCAAVLQYVAERVVKYRGAAVRLDRLAQPRLGRRQFAAPVVRFAEEIQGVGIARLEVQRLFRRRKRFSRTTRRDQLATLQNQVKRGLVVLRNWPPSKPTGHFSRLMLTGRAANL